MQSQIDQLRFLLSSMGLNEYQSSALANLLYLGETKATDLSKASGVPNARIYGVLEELAQKGLVIVRPGRPLLYAPMSPVEISQALAADARDEIQRRMAAIDSVKGQFEGAADAVYMKGSQAKVRTPLFRVVGVGDVSMEETRKLYREAKSELLILTRAMEYYPQVKDELKDAIRRGVKVRILLRSRDTLKPADAKKRDESLKTIASLGGDVEARVSDDVIIRGCVIDAKASGRAMFLVEEVGVPYHLREAAITSHPGVVKGLADMFNLRWEHESSPPD
jgi:sugar-specific transcriptional regulator TrmB